MQVTKTLWMLDYGQRECGHLVPIYVEDEQGAWIEANHWAAHHEIVLPEDALLVHFPHGFTVQMRILPGHAKENT